MNKNGMFQNFGKMEKSEFVNDYKINVFEIAWLDDQIIEKFTSDFKIVAKYFQTLRMNQEYKGTSEEIKHVDALFKMMTALTGDNSFEIIYNEHKFKKNGGETMGNFLEECMERGRKQEKEKIIMNLIESNAGSIEQIAEWVKLPVSEVEKIAQKVSSKA